MREGLGPVTVSLYWKSPQECSALAPHYYIVRVCVGKVNGITLASVVNNKYMTVFSLVIEIKSGGGSI